MKRTIFPVAVAGIWITAFEFLRNEFLFKSLWVDHYRALGLNFITTPVNGILWMCWSLLLAYVIFVLLESNTFLKTIFVSWIAAFVMMWITIYNLQVLPIFLLVAAIPLSSIEVSVAALIIRNLRHTK